MFPIHNAAGRLVGFGGRALGDDKAKYVNTAETDRFHKGSLLYGLHLAKREIRETGRAILCEGYFDVIGTVACGLEGAVAGMGTALTPEQTKLLARYTEEVVVAYDGDSAGENASRRALPLLLAEGLGVRRARFPGSHDPDSLRLEAGEEAVRAAIVGAEDAVTAELDRLIPADAPAIRAPRPRPPRRSASCCGRSRTPSCATATAASPPTGWDPGRDAGPPGGRRRSRQARSGWGVRAAGGTPARPVARRPAAPAWSAAWRSRCSTCCSRKRCAPRSRRSRNSPPPGVFLDTECRNIYEAFCALYAGAESPPDFQMLKSRLGEHERTVARLAKIMLEREVASGRIGLLESLDKLTDRWRRQRIEELHGEIDEAQRKGDHALRDRLVDEKTRLSRSLHRGSRQGANHGLG